MWVGFLAALSLSSRLSTLAAPLVVPISGSARSFRNRRKVALADSARIATNRVLAFQYADRTQRTIVPTLHLVETEHFLIFTAWNPSHDASLADVAERMYADALAAVRVPAN